MAKKRSEEFEEQKELIKLKRDADLQKHKEKMMGLEYSRENNRLFHERELERGRIKWAEIKKSQMRRQSGDYYRHQ